MTNEVSPPLCGDWLPAHHAGSGPWSVGQVWYDRATRRMALHVAPHHCNAYGVLHGGAMATFVDSQVAAAIEYRDHDPKSHTPTISLSVDYIGPVPVGSWLIGEVTVLRHTRNMIFTQAVLSVEGQVVARSNAIYRNVPGKVTQ